MYQYTVPKSGILNPDLHVDSEIDLQTEEVETTRENGNFVSWATIFNRSLDCSIGFELRPLDEKEKNDIDNFISKTCGCKLYNGGPCSLLFANKFYSVRAQCADLDKASLDSVLLGEIMVLMNKSDKVHDRGRSSKTRDRCSCTYCHEGVKVYQVSKLSLNFIPCCRDTFIFLHGISKFHLQAL